MAGFNPPATAEECHAAMDACLDKLLEGLEGVWSDRYDQLREYGEKTWPDEFPPFNPEHCIFCSSDCDANPCERRKENDAHMKTPEFQAMMAETRKTLRETLGLDV